MEGLIKFSDKYNLNTIFTIGNGQFHPVMTDYALGIDLEHAPDGNILPSPFYRGPVEINEDFEYLIPLNGPIVISIDDSETQEIPEGARIEVQDGARVKILSGWAKSINLANPPMREQWRNALCVERKPGGFPSVKPSTKEPTDVDQEWAKSLFPLSKNPKVFYNDEIKMDHETILKEYEDLKTSTVDFPPEVFKGATKEAEIANKLKIYENDGFKKSDLTILRKAVESYKNLITKAKAELSESQVYKDELIEYIREFFKFINDKQLRETGNKRTLNDIKKLEGVIEKLGNVDKTTGKFSGYIKKSNATTLIQNIKNFMISAAAADNTNVSSSSDVSPPNKVLKLVKDTNKALEMWRSALIKAKQQEKMERLNLLLVEAQNAANKNQPHNVEEIIKLVNEFKTIVGGKQPSGKCIKCKEKTKLVVEEMCSDCAVEHVDEICDYMHQSKHYKQFADPEQIEQFEEGVLGYDSKGHSILQEKALKDQWNDAQEKFLERKNAKNYEHWVEVAKKIKAFFDSFVPDSEEDEIIEDDSDESSSSSSSSFFDDDDDDEDEEEEEKEVTRKRPRDENHEDTLKSMVHSNDEERKKILELYQNGEFKRLRAMVEDINNRNTVQYRIVYFDKTTKKLIDTLNIIGKKYTDRGKAETVARRILDQLPDLDFRIDIINGQE